MSDRSAAGGEAPRRGGDSGSRPPLYKERGKRAAILAGGGAFLVLLLAFVYRERLWRWYLAMRWRRIAVVVLDDCDPDFRSPGPRGDSARFLDADGKAIFQLPGLNNCEAIGAHHAIALDPERFRIYLSELAGGRLTALDAAGRVLFRREGLEAGAMALDPETGNIWCLAGSDLSRGEIVVLDPAGNRIAAHPVFGFDIAYGPRDGAFWVAGYETTKLDREGRILFQIPRSGWARLSVAPDPRDGGAWVAERDHPDVQGSVNRLLRIDAQGSIVREIPLGTQDPFAVACDPESGTVWVADFKRALLRFSAGGEALPPLPISATAVAISPGKGGIWVSTPDAVLRLERDGRIAARHSFSRPSSQSWIATP